MSGTRSRNEHLSTEDGPETIWHVQHITLAETAFSLARGFRGGLGLESVVFFREVTTRIRFEDLERRPIVVPQGDIHHRNETLTGPGDPWVMAVAGRRVGPWFAALRGGVTVPLGRTEENPFELGRRGLSHQHIQFGTGTWDPLAGAGVGRRFGAVTATASVIARLPMAENDHGYHAGRRVQLSTTTERRIAGPWRALAGLDYARETAECTPLYDRVRTGTRAVKARARAPIWRATPAERRRSLRPRFPSSSMRPSHFIAYPVIVSVGWQ